MSRWYPTSNVRWSDYLQAKSLVGDIATSVTAAVRRSTADLAAELRDDTRALVLSERELSSQVESGLEGIGYDIRDLGARFDYGIGLVLDQLRVQSSQLRAIVDRLGEIRTVLENPLQTQARELFRIGCDCLHKGFLAKALEALLASARLDDTNFFVHLYIGKLYLYGRNDDDDVIDLELARRHLLVAVRYAKPSLATDGGFRLVAAEAMLHASIACYAMLADPHKQPEVDSLLTESERLANGATLLDSLLGEGWYQRAKLRALRGDEAGTVEMWSRAFERDRLFAARVLEDRDFDAVRPRLLSVIADLRATAEREASACLGEVETALSEAQPWSVETADSSRIWSVETAQTLLGRARDHFGSGTLFGFMDTLAPARAALATLRQAVDARRQAVMRALEDACQHAADAIAAVADLSGRVDAVVEDVRTLSHRCRALLASDLKGDAKAEACRKQLLESISCLQSEEASARSILARQRQTRPWLAAVLVTVVVWPATLILASRGRSWSPGTKNEAILIISRKNTSFGFLQLCSGITLSGSCYANGEAVRLLDQDSARLCILAHSGTTECYERAALLQYATIGSRVTYDYSNAVPALLTMFLWVPFPLLLFFLTRLAYKALLA